MMPTDNLAWPSLPKAPTGIAGFDEITRGGLPAGRPTLVCGDAGSGKTLFATTFLVNGAVQFGEPGVFMSFEERGEDLAANVASLGYDLQGLTAAGQVAVDYVRVERSEIEETGEYDLEGLFVRLALAVASVGAKRVVLDTIEALFSGLSDEAVLRAELRRLFGWLKDKGLTAVITGERGKGSLTRQGLEEYVSDCVVLLDHRVRDQVSTRRLRVVKYRGSAHESNEYPFLIDGEGISVLPVTSAVLTHRVSDEIISTGMSGLDAMFASGGFYRGSSVLISGSTGTGKTTMAAFLAHAACIRGERCRVYLLEESPGQVCRNARSIGLDLSVHVDAGLLSFGAARPSLYGLETHLTRLHRDLEQLRPDVVVIDPISAFRGPDAELHATMLRQVDLLKSRGITAVFTSLPAEEVSFETTHLGLSSLMDTWIRLNCVEANGELNRSLHVIKARGMSHSNQVREFRMTPRGIELTPPYIGPAGVLTGTARVSQVARERAEELRRRQDLSRQQRALARRRDALERKIAGMRAELESEEQEAQRHLAEEAAREARLEEDRVELAAWRSAVE